MQTHDTDKNDNLSRNARVTFQILQIHLTAQRGQIIDEHPSRIPGVEILWVNRDSLQGVGECPTLVNFTFLVDFARLGVDEDFTEGSKVTIRKRTITRIA